MDEVGSSGDVPGMGSIGSVSLRLLCLLNRFVKLCAILIYLFPSLCVVWNSIGKCAGLQAFGNTAPPSEALQREHENQVFPPG